MDSRGLVDVRVRVDQAHLESDGTRTAGATVSAVVLSVPEQARREHAEARRCLSRRQSAADEQRRNRTCDAEANFRRAHDADSEAFEADPAHLSHPQLILAEIYLRRSDLPRARAALSSFLTQHPDSPEATGIRQRMASLCQ